jgi:Flp pilus assembly protein protease CpaA
MDTLLGAGLGGLAGLGLWLALSALGSLAHPAGGAVSAEEAPGESGRPEPRGRLSPPLGAAIVGLALFGAYAGWRAPGLPVVVAALVVTALLAAITIADLRTRRIPNPLVLGLLLWAAVQSLWLGQPSFLGAALGLAAGGGLFLVLALLRRGAMGAGDVKLAAALGAVLGYPLVVNGLLWGVIAGGLAALVLLASGRLGRRDYMAYGPYLCLGAWLVWTRSLGLWP